MTASRWGGGESSPKVIWINGPFGVGKTTVARTLADLLPKARVVNPEPVGTMVRRSLPAELRSPDYQDDDIFRRGVVDLLATAAARCAGPVIAPHTVYNELWFDEIMSGLCAREIQVAHFTLSVSLTTLQRRISRGRFWPWPPTPAGWRRANAERCVDALTDERFATHIDAEPGVDAVARSVVSHLPTGWR